MRWSRGDIRRSVRRYFAECLGEPWVFRFERMEIENDERPLGLVDLGASRTTRARTSRIQGNVVRSAPLTMTLYPAVGEDPRAASRVAEAVVDVVDDLITIGLPSSAPYRIPLYDYAAVAEGDPGPEDPYDYLWVEPGPSVSSVQDPVDARRYAVIAEVTLSWESSGRVAPTGPLVGQVPGTWGGP